jgi:hypothetical protein
MQMDAEGSMIRQPGSRRPGSRRPGRNSGWLGVIALLLVFARPVHAQITGSPVFHSMKHDPNNSAHLDFAHAASDLSGNYVGLRFTRALNGESEQGPLRVSGLAGVHFDDGEQAASLGVSAGIALLRQHLVQMEPALGIGWTGGTGSRIDVPVSVAIGVVGSLPPMPVTRFASENPQLWLAPRAQLRFAKDASASRVARVGVGAGAGIELRWLSGIGAQLVFESIAMRDAVQPRWRRENALGFSLFYAWL